MFAKSKWFFVSLALVFAFVLTTCEELGYEEAKAVVNAATPTIEATGQPTGGSYVSDSERAKVKVTATVTDNGTLSYQWYTVADAAEYNAGGGTPIPGAINDEYAIKLEAGQWQLYVLVTNTNNSVNGIKTASVKSNLVSVLLSNPNDAQYPEITDEPASMAYDYSGAAVKPDALTVAAKVDADENNAGNGKDGIFIYQWYKATAFTNNPEATEAEAIIGATTATYQPPDITSEGTFYYFVTVTNEWPTAPESGKKSATTNSAPAVLKAVRFNATITVNNTKAQYVRGFGVMAPFWGNSPDASLDDYETMFNPDKGLGYNMLRVMIPVSQATNIRVTMNRALNNELSGDRDRSNYYDMVKLVNKYGGFVLASPWSPPPSWKTNNSIYGGSGGSGKAELLESRYFDYAEYLKEYCKIMLEKGAPIYAVSIQNEPNFSASYDGCEWSDNQMRDFFKQVGNFTDGVKGWGGGRELPRVLIMNGESANSPTINDAVLNDATARGIVDVYARHLYGSQQVTRSQQVQALGKEIWMTEYNVNGGNADTYPFDSTYNYMWKFVNTIDCVIRLNSENAFIWWYGVRFYSQIGDGDYTTVKSTILPRGYALSHYAKFASDTDRVELKVSGTNGSNGTIGVGSNFNNTSYDIDSTAVRATAFMSRDGNSISLVMFTPTNTSGTGGVNMGNIKIEFPSGFIATKVTAMRSRSGTSTENMGRPDGDTVLLKGGTAAAVNLPAGQMLSVKFTK